MKSILTILFILIVGTSFAQSKPDSVKAAQAVPLLSENDLNEILLYLDDKLNARDHRLVTSAMKTVLIQARQRKIKNK